MRLKEPHSRAPQKDLRRRVCFQNTEICRLNIRGTQWNTSVEGDRGPLTLKFDRATSRFLKFDRRH